MVSARVTTERPRGNREYYYTVPRRPNASVDVGRVMGQRMKGFLYSVAAGVCGSSSGTFGKIGMGVDEFFGIEDQVTAVVFRRFFVFLTRTFFFVVENFVLSFYIYIYMYCAP